jgi:hypothetical protein
LHGHSNEKTVTSLAWMTAWVKSRCGNTTDRKPDSLGAWRAVPRKVAAPLRIDYCAPIKQKPLTLFQEINGFEFGCGDRI